MLIAEYQSEARRRGGVEEIEKASNCRFPGRWNARDGKTVQH